jgi:hypothetical protein
LDVALLPGVPPGLEVSPVHFFQHVNIKGLISNNLFQPRIFPFKFFQPFRVIGFRLLDHVLGQLQVKLGTELERFPSL